MKTRAIITVVSLALAGGISSTQAQIVSDDFEYADQTAMNAVWVPDVGTGPVLSSAQSVSPTKSAYIDLLAQRSSLVFGDAPVLGGGSSLLWSFQYYDTQAGVSLARNYMQLLDNSDGLAQLVSMGVYNAVPGASVADHQTYYHARVTFGGGPGWILLDDPGAATRSVGWHELAAVFSASTVDFYVDGILSKANVTYGSGYTFDTMRLGSGLSTAGGDAYYDDVYLALVPEPSTVALGALGGLVMFGLVLRRRKS